MIVEEFKKGQIWNKPKNKLMLEFEKETGKNAVYRGRITGGFEFWMYRRSKKNIRIKEINTGAKKLAANRPEVKAKKSKAMKEVWNKPGFRENHSGKNHPMYGKHHSEETKKKMSIAKKGEKCYWYGKTRSDELKKKQSEALKKKWQEDPEYRENILKGYLKWREEQKR